MKTTVIICAVPLFFAAAMRMARMNMEMRGIAKK
jgi:hypothetical protein